VYFVFSLCEAPYITLKTLASGYISASHELHLERCGRGFFNREMKTCSKCKIEKSVEEFSKQSASKDGLYPHCKSCRKIYRSMLDTRIPSGLVEKMCGDCKSMKPISKFGTSKSLKDGLQWRCKECAKLYYRENSEVMIAQVSARTKSRLANDPVFRWVQNTRTNLRDILKGRSNHAPSLELLGCTGEEWRAHLESTFKPGMTWENYGRGEGKWQVDHITPVSSFDQEDHLQQLICWNFKNTQALWSHENMAKGDTISTEGGAA